MLDWTEFTSDCSIRMKRARVADGWLLADVTGPHAGRVSLVRDPSHDWDGTLIELR